MRLASSRPPRDADVLPPVDRPVARLRPVRCAVDGSSLGSVQIAARPEGLGGAALGVAPRWCGAVNGTSPRDGVGCESPDLILTAAQRAYVLQNSFLRRTRLLQRDQPAARSDFVTRCSPSCYSRTALVGRRLGYPALGHGHLPQSPLSLLSSLLLTVVTRPCSRQPAERVASSSLRACTRCISVVLERRQTRGDLSEVLKASASPPSDTARAIAAPPSRTSATPAPRRAERAAAHPQRQVRKLPSCVLGHPHPLGVRSLAGIEPEHELLRSRTYVLTLPTTL